MESRILQLIAALRASGVRVSLAESAEAFSAVDLMGIQHREHFRLSLRSTLIKDVRDLPVFAKLFPLFFGDRSEERRGGKECSLHISVDLMGIQPREHFRLSLRSTLIKDVRDLPVFDKLFPLFFGN